MNWTRTLVLSSISTMLVGCTAPTVPEQPLPFSHAIHVAKHEIACVDCHAGAERGVEAGLPSLASCLSCHMQAQGDADDIRDEKVRQRAAQGGEFHWVQVTRNPGHVYFSHRAHVSFAKMTCSECHGEVSTWAEAPKVPEQDLVDMDACMQCHRDRDASNDCRICHR